MNRPAGDGFDLLELVLQAIRDATYPLLLSVVHFVAFAIIAGLARAGIWWVELLFDSDEELPVQLAKLDSISLWIFVGGMIALLAIGFSYFLLVVVRACFRNFRHS